MTVVPQKLKLRVLWLKNVLGLAIDQIIVNQAFPLTPYYFWPRTEAWDQLKLELDAKSWLTEKEKIIVLNLATDVITNWRNSRNSENFESIADNFSEAIFVELPS